MREDLLGYYERELTFLRHMGKEFAEKYPKIASRLLLEPDRCEDPHVERLLEGFAFLAARVHLKIDDDFPEITTALLANVYPHYLRPLPSMSVVELSLDPEQGKLAAGQFVPRGSMLYSRAVEGVPCKFRTCYDTTLWPVAASEAQLRTPDRLTPAVKAPDAVLAVRVVLQCFPEMDFKKLQMKSLRFYLNGEGPLVHTLYELLCNNCTQVMLRDLAPRSKKQPVVLPASALTPLGFADDQALVPYPRRSLAAYRMLQEYFVFPEKYFFFDLAGIDQVCQSAFGDKVELIFFISRFERNDRQQVLEMGLTGSTFRLGCTPVVNLFEQTAEPILLDQTTFEYPVVPDVRRANTTEVFSVDDVVCTTPQSGEVRQFEPFFSYRSGGAQDGTVFWQAARRQAGIKDDQRTEVVLSLVDPTGRPLHPDADTLTVRCTCSNYTLPALLPFGNEAGDFELEGISTVRKAVCLRKPTPTLRPPTGKAAQWRLISHLSLNYLSLVEEGREALQHILGLYNFSDSTYLKNQIAGILKVESSRQFARLVSEHGVSSARGLRIDMEIDEEQFVGGGVYLFASVLEHFLGSYVTLNSFTQLGVTTPQRKEPLKLWPPRAGRMILI